MNGQFLFELNWPKLVHRLANHVHDAPKRTRADRNRNWPALVDGFHATHHAVRRLHSDAAHAAFTEMLLHFEDDVDGRGHLKALIAHFQRFIDRRHGRLNELHVDGGPGNLDYVSDVLWHRNSVFKLYNLGARDYCAAAPLTISIISFVIFAWRTRFMASVNESTMSVALFVAASIAVMRAACSAATDSSSP